MKVYEMLLNVNVCAVSHWLQGVTDERYVFMMAAQDLPHRFAQALRRAGTTAAFGVPGGGPNLDVVGAMLDEGMDFILGHGETASAIMAATHGLLTRTPTPVVVTRGPGATSVVNGAAQATLDRYPLVIVADTVPSMQRERVAHQRLDQRALFAPVTKDSVTLGADVETSGLDELVAMPTRWPFGAVHLDYDLAAETQTAFGNTAAPASPSPSTIDAARQLIQSCDRPVLIVGMEAAVSMGLGDVVTAFGAPTLTTYQAVGVVHTEGPLHAGLFTNGRPEAAALSQADLIITVGLDLVEPIPNKWSYTAPVVRISAQAQSDPYLPATVDVVGDIISSVVQLLEPGTVDIDWTARAIEFRESNRAQIRAAESSDTFGPVAVVEIVRDHLPENAITTVDAGAHFLAIMPLWPVAEPLGLLISNGLATMGFSVPAAIGAATAKPGVPVVAFTGDGGMGMALAELETIARRSLPITVIVLNDATLSLIRIKQTSEHGGDAAVAYRPTNFAEVASGCGLPGFVVNCPAELSRLLAEDCDGPRLLDVRIDPSSYPELIAVTRG